MAMEIGRRLLVCMVTEYTNSRFRGIELEVSFLNFMRQGIISDVTVKKIDFRGGWYLCSTTW
jgi:hypothetical protein